MQRAALQKAQHSQFVKDLQAEVLEAPQEDSAVGAAASRGTDTLALLKQQQRLEARAAIEEDMMVWCCSLCYRIACSGAMQAEADIALYTYTHSPKCSSQCNKVDVHEADAPSCAAVPVVYSCFCVLMLLVHYA